MAQERNLGTARALDRTDADMQSKAELQRQMDETRESISNTVSEIKETVTNQYQQVKESVVEALDWKEHFRRKPVAWSVGAAGMGFVVGYAVTGLVKGSGQDEGSRFESATTDRPTPRTEERASSRGVDYRPSYSSGYHPPDEEESESLVHRFTQTKAYDRINEEIGNLGNHLLNQAVDSAKTILLPMLFAKVGDLVGFNLSGNKEKTRTSSHSETNRYSGSSSAGNQESSSKRATEAGLPGARYAKPTSEQTTSNRVRQPAGTGRSSASYATSVNQTYGIEAQDREGYQKE